MRKILYFIAIFLTIQGVVVASEVKDIEVKGEKIPLIFERDSNLPIASMQIIFRASGSITEKKFGLAKFTAKMLNEGTKKLGSVGFAKLLESKAIHLSANCGSETFVFEISSLKEQFSEAVGFLKDLLSDPNFTQESFDKIKTITLGQLKQKETDYDYIASINLKELMFKDTPIGHPFLGDYESINSLNLKDVEDFAKERIILDRAIVVIGGDLNEDEAKKYSKEILQSLPKGQKGKIGFYNATDKELKKIVKKEDTKQAYIYFGSPYFLKVNDKDSYKSKVAMFILGSGGFGSRLMEEVRVKRGLAYSAYSRANLTKSYSDFTGYLQTKLESSKEAQKVVKDVIEKFTKEGVTQDELKQAKKFLLGSEPLRNETLSQRLSRAFLEYYNGFEQGYYKKQLELIKNLSLEDLNAFIKKHPEINKLSFAIVTK